MRIIHIFSFFGVIAVFILGGVRAQAGITWNVAGSGNWDTVTANWTNSAGASTTFTDDGTVDVIFNKTAGGTITISSNMSPLSTTVSAASGIYTFTNGPIDSGSMIKSGAGTLQLASSNSFAGGFTLNAGLIECAQVADVLGRGTITVNGGRWSGIGNAHGTHTNAVVINGGFWKGHNGGLNLTGPITLNCSPAITNSRVATSFSGVINDGGNGYGMTLENSRSDATISISGTNNTYSGKTIITGPGMVTALLRNEGVACGFGAPTGTNSVIDLYNGAVLKVNSGSDSDRTINIAGDGVGTNGIHLNGNATATIGGITVTGTGAKTLTLVKEGNAGKLTVNGPIPDAADGSKVSIEVPFGSARVDNFLDLKGTNTFSGSIKVGTLSWGFLRIGGAGSLGAGSYTNTISIANSCAFDYASSATQELSGVISGGGSVKMTGPGALTLSAGNTYTNGTTINGGVLYAGAEGALGAGNVTVAVSGRLVMTADNAMSTNATLNLPDDTTETLIMNTGGCEISALNLGAVPQPNGKYSASGYAWIGGTGSLYVGIPTPPGGTVIMIK